MSDRHPALERRIGSADVFRTLLRMVVGVVFMAHGFLKLTDMEGTQAYMASLGILMSGAAAWVAALVEFVGGLGLFVGMLTPIVAFLIGIVMITAIVTQHAGHGLMAAEGGFEYPLVLLSLMLYFIAAGAGPISMDATLRRIHAKHEEGFPEVRRGRRVAPADEPAES